MTEQHASVVSGAVSDLRELFSDPIHVVTRQDLLDDGTLVDVGPVGSEAGFRVPVALTREVWHDCVEWSALDTANQCPQDQEGRLWDVLFMAVNCAQRNRRTQQAFFEVLRIPRDGRSVRPELVRLKLYLGPDDDGKPCFTILQPGQD